MHTSPHSFHIPVMGLAFTIDTPLKVARFGISSAVSIVDDELTEKMRLFYAQKYNKAVQAIKTSMPDYRAHRITAYLNLLQAIVNEQIEQIKNQTFTEGTELQKYFELLPASSQLKNKFEQWLQAGTKRKEHLAQELKAAITPGAIDVNIMTKLDQDHYDRQGQLQPKKYAEAHSALRGFAQSNLNGSVIFSAGMNPRLYSYCEGFSDFFPSLKNPAILKKRIILKVSDFRSALIQGRFLAKKGLWVSEFRVESGLNCGGHAFATPGFLMGPILQEFKDKRNELQAELFKTCQEAHARMGVPTFREVHHLHITAQGGVGTHQEHQFLLKNYNLHSVGWGSPFLMVPEATTLDEQTRQQLMSAQKSDYYLSKASPLGVPFHNLRNTSSQIQQKQRIAKNRPGSPCYKKFLSSNTEFTDQPICTASRQYQHLKLKQIEEATITKAEKHHLKEKVLVKDCLCEGLSAPALLNHNITPPHNLTAVTICPGPNLAYFSDKLSLNGIIKHIYGQHNVRNTEPRANMFINELDLYIQYLKTELKSTALSGMNPQKTFFEKFRQNLLNGIHYYYEFFTALSNDIIEKHYPDITRQLQDRQICLQRIAIH